MSFELQAVKIKVDDRRMQIFDDSIIANESSKVVAFKYYEKCFATSKKNVKTTIDKKTTIDHQKIRENYDVVNHYNCNK